MAEIAVWQDLTLGRYVLRGVDEARDLYLDPEEAQRLYRELHNYFAPQSMLPLDQEIGDNGS